MSKKTMYNRVENSAAKDWQGYQQHLRAGGEPLTAPPTEPLPSRFSLLWLSLSVLLGLIVGAFAMSNDGVSVGKLIHAVLDGEMAAFMQHVLSNGALPKMLASATIGGLSAAGLYALASTSPLHHGGNRMTASNKPT